MKKKIAFLWVLNLVDAISTTIMVGSGLARELNPIAEMLILHNPIVFFLAKMAVITLCVITLFVFKSRKLVQLTITPLVAIYSALLIWHLILWNNLWPHLDSAQCVIEEHYQCIEQ